MLDKKTLEKEANNAIAWIKDYVERANAKGVVIGNSGGKDSATVLAMATKALGKERVLAISMPCNSINADFEDAKLVADTFGVSFIKLDLSNTYKELEDTLNIGMKELENISVSDKNEAETLLKEKTVKEEKNEISKEASINIKPRLRMTTLYAIAQTMGYLVIGTGNLCEAMCGYTTKWGDNSYDFNPIANFTVDEVLAIGEMLKVPKKILNKAPNDGLGGQTDEEKLGVKYSQIAEMIEKGETEKYAKEIIINKFKASRHKREKVPTYTFERKNYLLELDKN